MNPPRSLRSLKRWFRWVGFTLIEVIVIVATLSILVCVFVPSIIRERRKISCEKNLRDVGLAFKVCTLDGDGSFPMRISVRFGGTKELVGSGQVFVHFQVMSNELSSPKVLVCPIDREKKMAHRFDVGFGDTNVSYFVGVDAVDTEPNGLLSGDRNLAFQGVALKPGLFAIATNSPISWTKTMHHSCGYVALADGSVQLLNQSNLTFFVQQQSPFTTSTRLAIP